MEPSVLVSKIQVGDPIFVRQLNSPKTHIAQALQQGTAIGRHYLTHQFIEIYVTTKDPVYSVFTIGLNDSDMGRTGGNT